MSKTRWISTLALLLLANTVLAACLPSPASGLGDGAPLAVTVDMLPALAAALPDGPRADALRARVGVDATALASTRAAIGAEHARLRALGGQMASVLDGRQADWVARNRDRISLDRFEKPYWDRLLERLRR